jgi:uncharacterized damage-inducible protein DinB
MDEPVTYDAYLEVDRGGTCTAYILDLPGCLARGASQGESLAALTAEIPRYFGWLKRHDDYTPDVRGPFVLVPRQVLATVPTERGEAHVFFEPDAIPVDAEDMDWGTALLGWAADDLSALAARIPPAALDAPRPGGGWTIRRTLQHVADTQLWYMSRLDAMPADTSPDQLGADVVVAVRHNTATLMRRLRTADDATRMVIREHGGERWSLRKVLRLSVRHLRDHTHQLQQDAAALGILL